MGKWIYRVNNIYATCYIEWRVNNIYVTCYIEYLEQHACCMECVVNIKSTVLFNTMRCYNKYKHMLNIRSIVMFNNSIAKLKSHNKRVNKSYFCEET